MVVSIEISERQGLVKHGFWEYIYRVTGGLPLLRMIYNTGMEETRLPAMKEENGNNQSGGN